MIRTVVAVIRRMGDVEFNEEAAILDTSRIERHRLSEEDSDQTPFSVCGCPKSVGNEEELISTVYDGRLRVSMVDRVDGGTVGGVGGGPLYRWS